MLAAVMLAVAVLIPAVADVVGRTRLRRAGRPHPTPPAVADTGIGVGTVRAVRSAIPTAGSARTQPTEVTVDVETVTGQRFQGSLTLRAAGPGATMQTHLDLRPGVVLAVRFDPDRPAEVTLADDMVAARAAFDTMLIRKGLTTADKLDLIRRGTRSHGVVTAMQLTGDAREDFSEVDLHVMVSRPEGGQFPVREVTFIPDTSVSRVEPGSVIDTYYRSADPSRIAVCVPRT
jgi:hypothetical protein